MKVLCDVSLLGYRRGEASSAQLTGMPRSIVELGARLRDSPDCEVTFCAAEWPGSAYAFLREHPAFQGARLAPERGEGKLDAAALTGVRVFHATHGAAPAAVRAVVGTPGPAVVLTVYDMIPFLMPELFTPADLAYYADVLAQTRPGDHVITISQSAKRDFCAHTGHDPARVHVTYLAADAAQFRPDPAAGGENEAEAFRRVRARYGLPADDAPYFLSVCTFEPRKNLRHLIRSFAALVAAQPDLADLRLVLAGGTGWKFDAIFDEMDAADAARTQGRIIVTGFVAEEDLAPLYRHAWAFLYLSLYEGFGLPPLEAMRCGVPVVTADTSSLPEVVGDAGILLDPHDQDGLCQAMLDLYRRPALRQRLAAAALRRAERFSWERCARETVAVYHAAAADR